MIAANTDATGAEVKSGIIKDLISRALVQSDQDSNPAAPNLPIVELKEKGVILKGTTLLPAAELFKEMGVQLQVNSGTGAIRIASGQTKISAQMNDRYIWVNGIKKFYAVPPQAVGGKLMLPLQVLKDAFQISVTADYNTSLDGKQRPLRAVTLTTAAKKIMVDINSAYETYRTYLGKTAWIHKFINEEVTLLDGTPTQTIKNMAQVTLLKIENAALISGWLDVYFTYQNKTYKIKDLHTEDFQTTFLTANPYQTYSFSPKYWQLIENNKLEPGMTAKMVELSWYKPDRTYSSGENLTTWVYEMDPDLSVDLTFENGVFVSYQTEE
ncbi:copper amine oxidase N-terminal domain-containing protein [Paenibacillus pinistramenti]|uniref:copper amine oxidase N-terminal domain-containing protein n=1 Tax=Paenibacillus pinistramenti TaxID=1768003 RepID=UPI001396CA1C|nr:copper amine oxidase N-terminal domain-containing protein [Paenibacillus pinistramenti]